MHYLNGFLLGLSTGIFCVSYCAPIFLPQVTAEKNKHKGWLTFAEFNLGRLLAYIIFGALFGWLGAKIHIWFLNAFARWIIIMLAVLLVLYGLGLSLPRLKWCAWTKRIHLPFVSGFLLGINICPPFLLALTQNFQVGGAVNGIIFFCLFFAGTTLYLVPIAFLGYFSKIKLFRQAGRLAAITVGIIMLIQAI